MADKKPGRRLYEAGRRDAFAEVVKKLYVTRHSTSPHKAEVCMVCGEFRINKHQVNCPVIDFEEQAEVE